jgi:hypothetical protein
MLKVNAEIRELKKTYHKKMAEKKVLKQLWSYGFGQAHFDFYDLVWYYPRVHPSINKDISALGRWVDVLQ